MIYAVPMLGRGVRFGDAKYEPWKPLIPVRGSTIINWTLRSFPDDDNPVWLIVPRERVAEIETHHFERSVRLVVVDRATKGPADTALALCSVVREDEPIVVGNCDQYVLWDFVQVERWLGYPHPGVDGVIATFDYPEERWSFVHQDGDKPPYYIKEVRAKDSFGIKAVVGVYAYKTAGLMFDIIRKGLRTMEYAAPNGELYMCPLYNYLPTTWGLPVSEMHPLGVPSDLKRFEELEYVYGE